MAQCLIRPGSGPKSAPMPATLLRATCSMKWLRGKHAAELAPPWLPPPPRPCLCLCSFGGAPEHPLHPPPLLPVFALAPRFASSTRTRSPEHVRHGRRAGSLLLSAPCCCALPPSQPRVSSPSLACIVPSRTFLRLAAPPYSVAAAATSVAGAVVVASLPRVVTGLAMPCSRVARASSCSAAARHRRCHRPAGVGRSPALCSRRLCEEEDGSVPMTSGPHLKRAIPHQIYIFSFIL
jgi:hypothetical protein